MKKLIAYAVSGVVAMACLAGGAFAYHRADSEPVTFAAVVKVVRPGGLGSGVSIGNGLVQTAAHVVKGAKTVSLESTDGRTGAAEILWINEERDIALLRTDMDLPDADINCAALAVGDDIIGVGNPLGAEFITAFGKIAGKSRSVGDIKSVYVTDMTTVMGMSGGPIFDKDGKVAGVVSMVMVAQMPMNPMLSAPSLTGYGFVVPQAEVCLLMGRVV